MLKCSNTLSSPFHNNINLITTILCLLTVKPIEKMYLNFYKSYFNLLNPKLE